MTENQEKTTEEDRKHARAVLRTLYDPARSFTEGEEVLAGVLAQVRAEGRAEGEASLFSYKGLLEQASQGLQRKDKELAEREAEIASLRQLKNSWAEAATNANAEVAELRKHGSIVCQDLEMDQLKKDLSAERTRREEAEKEAEGLAQAVEKLITQFKVILMNQHRLLVRGQDLESASRNWQEATEMQVLEFEPVMEALAAYRAKRK